MSKVKDGNYYVVQSFMVKDMGLKGLERDLYAIIYGFSQAESQTFTGSLQYLADWTNSSKQGVIKALKSLEDKGFIARKENIINGVKFVEYYSTEFNTSSKLSLTPIKPSLTNNIDNNINNKELYSQVIDFLNETVGTNYKIGSKKTQQLISARFNEGFTVDDFKTVITKKYQDWKNSDMEKYLRPETLFGTKFESYLNGKVVHNNNKSLRNNVDHRDYSQKDFDNVFDNLDNIDL